MVDPLEAKRMAAKEMEKIKAKEKLKVSEVNRQCCSLWTIWIVFPISLERREWLCNVCCEMWMQRRRQIEAINGAWAMIGLTAGLIIEGQTGKGILAQVRSYSLFHSFMRHLFNLLRNWIYWFRTFVAYMLRSDSLRTWLWQELRGLAISFR